MSSVTRGDRYPRLTLAVGRLPGDDQSLTRRGGRGLLPAGRAVLGVRSRGEARGEGKV